MTLEAYEVQQFYRIWFPLLNYVNEQRNLSPEFPEAWRRHNVAPEVALPLQTAVWKDDTLREGFIRDNPADLSDEDLAMVDSWQHRVGDKFILLRHLKRHSVFLGSDNKGYAVLGITDRLDEILLQLPPVMVYTVLIPFGDRIIYDGIIGPYNLSFGSGYRSSFNDTYRDIQERGGLITSLPPDPVLDPARIVASNKKVLAAFKRDLGRAGLSPKKIEEHSDNLAHFAEAQNPPVLLLDITLMHIDVYARTYRVNWVSFKRFLRFLRDTGRIDYNMAEFMLKELKER
jgi:hypothetical protein